MSTAIPATRSNSRLALVLLAIVTAVLAATLYASRERLLLAAGWSLVASDPVSAADLIVVSADSGGAGALKAADLVERGIARRVAVFTDPPSGEDLEFIRRGLPYDDGAARQTRQLKSLGVTEILEIPRPEAGTGGEIDGLQTWCRQHHCRSVVFVVARDHSRRIRRVLDRTMEDGTMRFAVQPETYSDFDPDRWWQSRGGLRRETIEMQKLLLDVVRHPF